MEPVLEWDVAKVTWWFNQNGFQGYEDTLKENSIDGEVLVNLDHDSLKDLGIPALGKRLLVLKSVYFLKLQHEIPITTDSYVPQTVDVEPDYAHGSSYQRKQKRYSEETISRLMEEITSLSSEIATIKTDMQRIYRLSILENKPLPAPVPLPVRQMNDPFVGATIAARRNQALNKEYDGPGGGSGISAPVGGVYRRSIHQHPYYGHGSSALAGIKCHGGSSLLLPNSHASSTPSSQTPVTPHIRVYGDNALQRENESYKSFRISADDPCSTILPHALKKYHIFDAWHNYSLCIQYGPSGKGKNERVLALDEKPLQLFQQLKDAGESPVFVLKKKNSGMNPSLDSSLPHRLSVRGSTFNGNGSRTSLFSLEQNNTSSSSLEMNIGNLAGASSSNNEFEKL
ncbi:hypothetical protein BX661DRAFT_197847 [Kickxella alabastrina]|uniref:uncharacterized protein n=1 Tax=Kickxella alabastrina TaxID=61397 RepID=UPI00221EF270|nr:uncharacterized protein BX661DRAFT_197847 [Kickxella alabastrina]KAI7829040.1 hypothetical protein BX661DRAFT_197847 [Kickxella alabastrina]